MTLGFIKLRKGIQEHLLQHKMNGYDFMVYCFLLLYADFETGIYHGNAGGIGTMLSESPHRVGDSLRRLRDAKYINYQSKGSKSFYDIIINKYEITNGPRAGNRVNAFPQDDEKWLQLGYSSATDELQLHDSSATVSRQLDGCDNALKTTDLEENSESSATVTRQLDYSSATDELQLDVSSARQYKNIEERTKKEELRKTDDDSATVFVKLANAARKKPKGVSMPISDVQEFVNLWNSKPYLKKYNPPHSAFQGSYTTSTLFAALITFCASPNWKERAADLFDAFEQSEYLRKGGTPGNMNTMAWVFKNDGTNFEKIVSGFYVDKTPQPGKPVDTAITQENKTVDELEKSGFRVIKF